MHRKAIIGLGSNLGDRYDNLQKALQWLENVVAPPVAASSVWESEPWGYQSTHPYLNRVVILSTDLEPKALLRVLLGIERRMGRDRQAERATADRPIDLDLLGMEDLVVTEDGPDALVLPHPRMHLRRFVLEPLNEVWPRWVHPVLGQSVVELLKNCTDTSAPVRVEPVVGGMETLA